MFLNQSLYAFNICNSLLSRLHTEIWWHLKKLALRIQIFFNLIRFQPILKEESALLYQITSVA